MKYIRTHPKHVKNAPPHRFVNYVHKFSLEHSQTKAEYIEQCKEVEKLNSKEWTKEKEKVALEALEWLIENDLIKVVQSANE